MEWADKAIQTPDSGHGIEHVDVLDRHGPKMRASRRQGSLNTPRRPVQRPAMMPRSLVSMNSISSLNSTEAAAGCARKVPSACERFSPSR